MNTKSFEIAALVFTALAPTVAHAVNYPDCAADPSQPTASITASAAVAVWELGGQVFWEIPAQATPANQTPANPIPGGLARSASATTPDFAFASTGETIAGAEQMSDGRFLIITSTARGFASYVWDPAKATMPWTATVSAKLDEGFQNLTVHSPIADVAFRGDSVYLLSNFHVREVSAQALVTAGETFTPRDTPLSSFQATDDPTQVSRAMAFLQTPWSGGLNVAEKGSMFNYLGSPYFLESGYDTGQIQGVFVPELQSYPYYFQVRREHDIRDSQSYAWTALILQPPTAYGQGEPYAWSTPGTPLSTPGMLQQGFYGQNSSISTQTFADFASAATFDHPADPANGLGVISFFNRGTFLFRDGQALCRITSAPLQTVVMTENASARVQIQGVSIVEDTTETTNAVSVSVLVP